MDWRDRATIGYLLSYVQEWENDDQVFTEATGNKILSHYRAQDKGRKLTSVKSFSGGEGYIPEHYISFIRPQFGFVQLIDSGIFGCYLPTHFGDWIKHGKTFRTNNDRRRNRKLARKPSKAKKSKTNHDYKVTAL